MACVTKQDLAHRIRALRESAGLSQKTVAKHTMIHVQTLRRWEQGRTMPDPLQLEAFARAIGRAPGALFSADGSAHLGEVVVGPESLVRLRTEGESFKGELLQRLSAGLESALENASVPRPSSSNGLAPARRARTAGDASRRRLDDLHRRERPQRSDLTAQP